MLVNCATDSASSDQLQSLDRMIPPHVMYYMSTALLILNERFVNAWIRSRHFGHTSTSSVDGAHAAVKKWISVSLGVQGQYIFQFF